MKFFWPGANHNDLISYYLARTKGLEVAHDRVLPLHSIKQPAKNMHLPYSWSSMNEHTT